MSSEFFTGEPKWLGDLERVTSIPGGFEISSGGKATLTIELVRGMLRIRGRTTPQFQAVVQDLTILSPPEGEEPLYKSRLEEDVLILEFPTLQVRLTRWSGEIEVREHNGHIVCSGLRLGFTGCRPTVVTRLHSGDRLHGTGLRSEPFNLRGRSAQIWTNNKPNPRHSRDSSYAVVPFVLVHRPVHGCFGMFFNNPSFAEVDLAERNQGYLAYQAWSGDVDVFVIPGRSPQAVMKGYTDLTGRLELPPQWVYGFGHSRYGMKSAQDVMLRVVRYTERRLPLQWMALDLDYMTRDVPWTWNEKTFGPPGKLSRWLGRNGQAMVCIMDPLVPIIPEYEPYETMLRRGLFCSTSKGELAVVQGFAGPSHVPDIVIPGTTKYYTQLFAEAAKLFGVSGFWLDKNELATKQAPVELGGGGAAAQSATMGDVETLAGEAVVHVGGLTEWEVHNLFGLGFSRAAYDGLLEAFPDRRPFVLSRAHFAGSQRWACGWTGDNHADFGSLKNSVPQLLNLGLSGLVFYGMDIGGFFGHCTTELLVRWVQYGVFNPLARIHSFRETVEQVPWHHGNEAREIIKRFLELRTRLAPLTNDLFWKAMEDGTPLMRPLIWDYWQEELPDHPWIPYEFLWGPFLVAPVVDAGHLGKEVYLPGQGQVWYDFWTRRPYEGGRSHHVEAKLDTLPLFIKAGSIVPMGRPLQDLTTNDNHLFLLAYSGGKGSHLLHLDDGESNAYKTGGYSTVLVEFEGDAAQGRLKVTKREGAYIPEDLTLTLRFFVVQHPSSVMLDGQPIDFGYHPENGGSIAIVFEYDGEEHIVEYRA